MTGSLNKVILVGRLGQDPKLAYMPDGKPVASLSVATSESWKDREGMKQEKTEWHRISVFGQAANFCGKYLTKGALVYIEGQLRTRKWQNQEGQDRYMTEIIVNAPGHKVQALESLQNPQHRTQAQPPEPSTTEESSFPISSSGMDDVPF